MSALKCRWWQKVLVLIESCRKEYSKTGLFGVTWYIYIDVSRMLCVHSSHIWPERTLFNINEMWVPHSVVILRYLN